MPIIGAPLQEQHGYSIYNYPATENEVSAAVWDNMQRTSGLSALQNLAAESLNNQVARRGPKQYLLSADEANSQYGDVLGKEYFKEPVSPSYAKTLAENRAAQDYNDKTIARGRGGFVSEVSKFGVGLAAAMTDPVNVGAAFIPIVGEARFASMVGAMGLRTARVTKGAIEGGVGTVAIEPLVYAGAQAGGYRYDYADSVMNIALGTVMGGGLHFAGGEIRDAWQAKKTRTLAETGDLPLPEKLKLGENEATSIAQSVDNLPVRERADLLRTAVGQMTLGRQVDIEATLRTYSERMMAKIKTFDLGELTGNKYKNYTEIGPQDAKWLQGVVAELQQTRGGTRIFTDNENAPGQTVTGYKGDTPDWFTQYNKEASRLQKQRARDIKKNQKVTDDKKLEPTKAPSILTREKVAKVAEKMLNREPLGKAEGDIAATLYRVARGEREENVRQMVNFREQRAFDREAEAQADIDAVAQREAAFWEDEPTDAEHTIKRSIELPQELEESLAELDERVNNEWTGFNESEMNAIDAADEAVTRAEEFERGLLAAATCIYRGV